MNPKGIIIHCADTPNGSPTYSAKDIDEWHAARGFSRGIVGAEFPHIGYHYVIEVDGLIVSGRAEDETGAHCRGRNDMIGICMLGKDRFTTSQWHSLGTLVLNISSRHGGLQIYGHRDFDSRKICPGFGVTAWLHKGMAPLKTHLI